MWGFVVRFHLLSHTILNGYVSVRQNTAEAQGNAQISIAQVDFKKQ